jgi:DNA-directed RNA polymerase subunit RPC12/RpoP
MVDGPLVRVKCLSCGRWYLTRDPVGARCPTCGYRECCD